MATKKQIIMSLVLYIFIGVMISALHDALVHYVIQDTTMYFTNIQRVMMTLIWPVILLLLTIKLITRPNE